MATMFHALITCLTGVEPETSTKIISDEKHVGLTPHQPHTAEEVAEEVVRTIVTAEKGGTDLARVLNNVIGEYGWTEKIAQWVLVKMECALKEAEKLQGPLGDAYNEACEAALSIEGFVQEHPVFCTVIALGVLAILTPWVLGALGFGELGPIEGMFCWQIVSFNVTVLTRFRILCGGMASAICGLRAERVTLFLFPALGNDVACSLIDLCIENTIRDHFAPCRRMCDWVTRNFARVTKAYTWYDT